MIRRKVRERCRRFLLLALPALFVNSVVPFFHVAPVHAALTDVPTPSVRTLVVNPNLVSKINEEPRLKTKKIMVVRASAYSSTRDQTDSDPFTTASGKKVRNGTLATNCLPFGTKIRIPSHYGSKIFTVEDRMHNRWGCKRVDLWMNSRKLAKQWGVRTVRIEVL